MKTVKIRCKDLMVGDWVANRNGSPMQIVSVDEDNAYACEGNNAYACEGNEERPWIFGDDEGYEPQPIILTPEILEKNGWWFNTKDEWLHDEVNFIIEKWNGRFQCYDINDIKLDSVHELQQALRLCGFNELADNFKI